MEKEATIVGTQEGCYLACIDEEKALLKCDEECSSCALSTRALLKKEQPIDKGRRVLADIQIPLFTQKGKLCAVTGIMYVVFFMLMFVIIKSLLPYYRGILPAFFGGFFGASSFYLIQKLSFEQKGGEKRLRRGRVIRVYPQDRS
ncbi:hypothetical protein JW926_13330 [Candidatus Sumerlaeota bacterium]|nr:hypothetical protein [Candidatus Sumerlaeota bacterium]